MSENNHEQITQGGVYQTGTQSGQQYYNHVVQNTVNQSAPVKYQVMLYNTQADYSNIQQLESLPRGSYSLVQVDNGHLVVEHPTGTNSHLTGTNSHLTGTNSYLTGTNSHPTGTSSYLTGTNSHSTGTNSHPTGTTSYMTGTNSHLTGTNSHPTSTNSYPTSTNSYPTGTNSYPTGTNSHPIGTNSYMTGTNLHPTGTNSHLTGTNSHPTGTNSDPTGANLHMEYRTTSPDNEQKEEDSQLLLCSETFTSPTPPSDDSGWTSTGPSIVWTHSDKGSERESAFRSLGKSLLDNASASNGILPCLHKKIGQKGDSGELLKAALLGDNGINKNDNHLKPDINSNFQTKCSDDNLKFTGNEVDSGWRMSGPNGFDRHRMTGSSVPGNNNNNLSRLSDGSSTPGQVLPQSGSTTEGMLLGRIGGTGGVALHDISSRSIVAGTVGAGPQVTVGVPVFRPPHSVTETARYATAFTTAAGSSAVGPYSPVYATGSHGAGLAPYSAFYSQYPGYSAGVMHGTIDPQLGSYSAVLQSMGTHAAQSQVPRTPYAGAVGSGAVGSSTVLGQYSMGVPLTTSPSGKTYIGSTSLDRDENKYRRDTEMEKRRYSTGVIKEEKHQFSVPSGYTEQPSRVSFSTTLRESPSHSRDPQDYYKGSSGREGSLKHRILRPESVSTVPTGIPHHSAFNTDEPLTKRTKLEHSGLDSKDANQKGSRFLDPGRQTPDTSGRNPRLHYPPHFQKGSIIQLGNGEYKRVEDLETNDFRVSADVSSDLKIDSSTVVQIDENEAHGTAVLGFAVGEHKIQVTVEATVEHPFFVFGQGWSSCEPTWTMKRYGLDCQKLSVGDICVSLTHKEVTERAEEISLQQQQQQQQQIKIDGNSLEMKAESSLHQRESPGQSQGHRNRSESGLYSESNISASAKGERVMLGSSVSSHTQEHRSLPSTTS